MAKLNSRTANPSNLLRNLQVKVAADKYVVARYSATEETKSNWGDAINPLLIEHLSGKKVVNINDLAFYNGPVYSVIGSILGNNNIKNLHVWGSGFKNYNANVKIVPSKIYAVRGPLTQNRFKELGIECPSVYGDPAILYKDMYNPSIEKKYKLGIIPHYVEKNNKSIKTFCEQNNCLLIDIQAGNTEVIDQVKSCSYIASSSLHGLILSDMYDIPSKWIKIEGKLDGDDFKFHDYYASAGVVSPSFIQFQDNTTLDELVETSRLNDVTHLAKNLKDSNPF